MYKRLLWSELLALMAQHGLTFDTAEIDRYHERVYYGWVSMPTEAVRVDGVVYATMSRKPFELDTAWFVCPQKAK